MNMKLTLMKAVHPMPIMKERLSLGAMVVVVHFQLAPRHTPMNERGVNQL